MAEKSCAGAQRGGSMDLMSVATASSFFSALTNRVTLDGRMGPAEHMIKNGESLPSVKTIAPQHSTTAKSQVTTWSSSKSSSQQPPTRGKPTDKKAGRYKHVPLQQESSSHITTSTSGKSEVVSKAQDILRAYRFFCTIDVDVSGRVEGRCLIRLLTDIDVHPKDDPVLAFMVVVPELDCGLRFEEQQDGNGGTCLVVDTIEDQSPAMYIKQLTTGLRVVDLEGVPIHSIADLTAASKSILAAQRKKGPHANKTVAFRFQEPAYLVDRYNHGLEIEVMAAPSGRQRKLLLQQQQQQQQHTSQMTTSVGLGYKKYLLQVVLPEGAYTTRQDFVDMLQNKLTAAVTKEQVPGRFDVLLSEGDIVIRSTKCTFKMPFKTGEWSQRSAHTLLGFDHEDTKEAKEHVGKRPRVRGVDVGYLTRKQMDQLGTAIMMRYDATTDSFMNFEEFYAFYTEFLVSSERVHTLRAWIKDQFLSETEAKKKDTDAKEAVERERRKGDIEKFRDKNREIRSRQRTELRSRLVKDSDGQTRQRHKQRRPPPICRPRPETPLLPDEVLLQPEKKAVPEVDEYMMSRALKTTRRHMARTIKQTQQARPTILQSQVNMQCTQQRDDQLQVIAKNDKNILHLAQHFGKDMLCPEKPAVLHPAFFGYLPTRDKAFDPALINPIFFNYRVLKANKSSTKKMAGMRHLLADIIEGAAKHYRNDKWRFFPHPRTNTVQIRQTLRSALPKLYDEGQIIHPACFGSIMVSVENQSLDSSATHPSMVGFKFHKKPLTDAQTHKLLHLLVKDKITKVACDTCTISKPGCPTCWEMPVGFIAADYEFTGPTTNHHHTTTRTMTHDDDGSAANAPPIHTKLTTERALYWHRKLFHDYITVYIKSLPYGAITVLQVEKSDTVSYLYHLFLANCPYGDKEGCLYIPHTRGCFCVDNTFLPASDLASEIDTGREPLCNYNLRVKNTRVLLMHVQSKSMDHSLSSMSDYIRLTLNRPMPSDYRVIYELNDIPSQWEDDEVQTGLLAILDEQLENMERYTEVFAHFRPPTVSKRGTVKEDKDGNKAARLTTLRTSRKHEVKKILGLQHIVITEGGGMTGDGEVQVTRQSKDQTNVHGLLKRQRYRKPGGTAQAIGPADNLFLTLGASMAGLNSQMETDFYHDLN